MRERGGRLREGLEAIPGVAEVRGRGLMLAAGLAEGIDAAEAGARLLEAGLIVNVPSPQTLRMLPPLTVGEAEVDEALAKLRGALS